jgi:phytol kinase
MAWGDGLAALVGQRWGRHSYKILGSQKSWEGSGTMALVSFLVTGLLLSFTHSFSPGILAIAAIVALASTGLESFSRWGIDNLTVPVGSALLAFGCSQLWLR